MTKFKEDVIKEILKSTETDLIKKIIKNAISKMKKDGIKQPLIARFIKQLEIAIQEFDKINLTMPERDNLISAQNMLTLMLIKGF